MENVGIANTHSAACEYAVASRPFPGERQSGDAALVDADADNILVAVVDGLGHGEEAAHAADVAIKALRTPAGRSVSSLLQHCHEALRPTRGAAVALATLQASGATLTWSGVGNVEGVLIPARYGPPRRKEYLINQGGVVGYRMPAVRARTVSMQPGDVLILASDGVDERFAENDMPAGAPEQMARAILERHGKESDDALVLVLRWLGTACGGTP
ncbi:serine/threonine-protein phosphatase [Dechloromonas sp. XY25]|uniref:Serine/threonine-protein phosphatase n=1 Tax=Dechloromonas hankyongensis TaxID=2908002 RepID=A0ABS9JYT2_9RHOO|nr:SpoIIE family protein phosphatase [Dechloromonas hankyongensis]MCG2576072.1 serine/threonine-protein phosphatase [Dechloromonas hankyongensis]